MSEVHACPRCGAPIGWLGAVLQRIGLSTHRCQHDALYRYAAEQRLHVMRVAAERAERIIDLELFHQREKVKDAKTILRNALNETTP